MNILVLRSNPRKDGHTQAITDLVVQGAQEAGAKIKNILLFEEEILQCTGCYHCWTETPGKCIHDDVMSELLKDVLAADILLCSTPLYNYTMSSSMKIFFERTLPLMKPGFEKNPKGLLRNYLRYPQQWRNKKLAIICAGAFKQKANFDGVLSTFKLLADGLHMDFAGELIRPESYLLQFSFAKPKTVKVIESALMQSGRELAKGVMISEKNREHVAIPLSSDVHHFKKYSNIYWEQVNTLKEQGIAGLKEIQNTVARDVRILMHEMARSFDPLTSANLAAAFQFEFPDKGYYYCIKVNKGSCSIEESECGSFDLKVTVNSDVWAQIFTREKSAKEALLKKEIVIEGDKALFARLDRYFPPPSS